jgi:hypothetical protein
MANALYHSTMKNHSKKMALVTPDTLAMQIGADAGDLLRFIPLLGKNITDGNALKSEIAETIGSMSFLLKTLSKQLSIDYEEVVQKNIRAHGIRSIKSSDEVAISTEW